MFVQIIEGRTNDAAALKALGEEWDEKLRPGATGYVGVTSGSTADGRTITLVTFDSPEAARANSDRPEQTEFWNAISKFYDGEPTFSESTDTEEFMGGMNPNAGFVQIMKSPNIDRAQVKELDAVLEKFAAERPDLLGIFRVWTGPNSSIEAAYFTSESEARAGESKELPADMQKLMADFGDLMQDTEFLDLTDPTIR